MLRGFNHADVGGFINLGPGHAHHSGGTRKQQLESDMHMFSMQPSLIQSASYHLSGRIEPGVPHSRPAFAHGLPLPGPASSMSAPTPPESRPRTTGGHFWGPPPPFAWGAARAGLGNYGHNPMAVTAVTAMPHINPLWVGPNGHPIGGGGGMPQQQISFLVSQGGALHVPQQHAPQPQAQRHLAQLPTGPSMSFKRPMQAASAGEHTLVGMTELKRARVGNLDEMGPVSPNTVVQQMARRAPPEMDLPQSKTAESSPSTDDSAEEDDKTSLSTPSTQRGAEGERRLTIDFESYGSMGLYPQTHGHLKKWLIPDGLVGKHFAYDEQWRFEVRHTDNVASIRGEDGQWRSVPRASGAGQASPSLPKGAVVAVCLQWRITNLKSGETVEAIETPQQATVRMERGSTIASPLFREALRKRASNLEDTLDKETNLVKRANLESMIKVLNPRNFTQGPLMFGLKHRSVQAALSSTPAAN